MDERLAAYTGDRPEARIMVPDAANSILDVGCSNGAVGSALSRPGRHIIGIERDYELAKKAEAVLDEVICDDALSALKVLRLSGRRFESILLLDVLEHLEDPWAAVAVARDLLGNNGCMVISLPNVTHWTTYLAMLRGSWPRRGRGIHDATHLRFFGRQDARALVTDAGMRIDAFHRVFRTRERATRWDALSPFLGRLWPDGFTYQFVVRAR